MKKSCSRCGRIHNRGECAVKTPPKKPTDAARFHSSSAWARRRKAIRYRDNGMCQVCVKGLYEPLRILNTHCLDVHHIVSLTTDFEKRFDGDNLITLCDRHHEMADCGKIPASLLKELAGGRERGGN